MNVDIISGSQTLGNRLRPALKSARLPCRQYRSVRAYLLTPPSGLGCIVLDVHGLRQDCGASIDRLRRRGVFHPVIVAAKAPTLAHAVEACKAGAADFVECSLPGEEWIARIQAVLEEVRRRNSTVSVSARPSLAHCGLTPRELEVLHHLADGLDSTEIARKLKISLRTVEGYRSSIKQRTGAKTLAQLVRLAMESEA